MRVLMMARPLTELVSRNNRQEIRMTKTTTIKVTAEELAVLRAWHDAQYARESAKLREAEDGYPRARELFYRDTREDDLGDDDY